MRERQLDDFQGSQNLTPERPEYVSSQGQCASRNGGEYVSFVDDGQIRLGGACFDGVISCLTATPANQLVANVRLDFCVP